MLVLRFGLTHKRCTSRDAVHEYVHVHRILLARNARQHPLYARIADLLRQALASGALPPGMVLLEGRCPNCWGHAQPRAPGLRELENEGLVARFDGRGMLAGGASETPLRQPLTPAMLGLGDESEPVRKAQGWEHIYHAVEHDVVHLSVFGAYRLNEVELARHFGVSRTAARDVLLRLKG